MDQKNKFANDARFIAERMKEIKSHISVRELDENLGLKAALAHVEHQIVLCRYLAGSLDSWG